jgi:hypothetical protein
MAQACHPSTQETEEAGSQVQDQPSYIGRPCLKIKILLQARCWWLTPVILATWEAEIRRIMVRSQPRHSSRDPISKDTSQKRAREVTQGEGPEFKPQY